MEIERQSHDDEEEVIHCNNNSIVMETIRKLRMRRVFLLCINIFFILIGGIGGPLLIRAYFRHGGDHRWFSGFLQTAGFPFLIIPMLFSFLRHPRRRREFGLFLLTPSLLFYCIVLGLLTGLDDFLYSYGVSFLPLSTATLLMSTQLGFTVIFSFFIVKQKLNAFTVNAVVLLTFGVVILGVRANNDLLNGESKERYFLGFIMTLGAAVIYSMVLPLLELIYIRTKQEMAYELVVEMQFFMGFFASIFCALGMGFNKDFQAISRESELYGLGKAEYYLVVFFTTVTGQFFFLGTVGTIKYSSALLCGVIIAACIPVTEVLAVFFFQEKFDGVKGVALALSLWGTASYFYGEYKEHSKSSAYTMEPQHHPL